MARRQVVTYTVTCDVCGAEVADNEVEGASSKFRWEGTEFVVELCSVHQAALNETRDRLKVFAGAGRRIPAGMRGRPRKGSSPRAGNARGTALAAIRTWALENGHKVGDRGRIPGAVMVAYREFQEADSSAE